MLQSTPRPTQNPEMITGTGAVRCRFDLFVSLLPGAISRSPSKQRSWCHRGDKFTSEPDAMLCSLLRMFTKRYTTYQVAELYDNTRPKNDPERIVLRWCDGVIEVNRLATYAPMLSKIALPEFLQP